MQIKGRIKLTKSKDLKCLKQEEEEEEKDTTADKGEGPNFLVS